MSTNYYKLKYPITSIRIDENPVRVKISLWIDHGFSGTLTISSKQKTEFLYMLFNQYEIALRTHWGGKDRGTVVTVIDSSLPDNAYVRSNYNEILTVADVKKRDGAKNKDEITTDLLNAAIELDKLQWDYPDIEKMKKADENKNS